MTVIWVDAQISPSIARWLTENFEGVRSRAVRDVGLRDAQDIAIFDGAATAGAVILTKDDDFRTLHDTRFPAPAVILLTCGNTSNARLREILAPVIPRVLAALLAGESIFEVNDESSLTPPKR